MGLTETPKMNYLLINFFAKYNIKNKYLFRTKNKLIQKKKIIL